jgi:diguanylate cyclase (GGDEF)-like protein/PAS domain S-box-containing protein
MADLLDYLFGAAAFVPHGYCLLWRPDLVALHAVSDVLTAAAYFSIPCAIVLFVRRRSDLHYPWLAGLFATFILACGITHVADFATLWVPAYGLQGLLKAGTATVSVVTAVALWPLLPRLLALPSPAALQRQNDALGAEVARRAAAESALARARDQLELRVAERTVELAEANLRLEAEIVERRRAEEIARASEARLRTATDSLRLAVEATSLGIWDVDAVSETRRWSDEQKAILGLSPESEPDYALFDSLIHPEDRQWVNESYRRAFVPASGGRYTAEFRIGRARDGAVRWVAATGRVFFDATGQPIRAIGTLADVTERVRAVAALRESEERYRALIDTGPDAVYVHRQGVIVVANQQAAALFGARDAADLIGREIFALVDEASLQLARARTAALATPGARAELCELTYRRLDGTPFAVEAAAVSVLIDCQLVIQVVFRDITARKLAESVLEARTAELETVMETVPVAVWLAHDTQSQRISGNRFAAEMLRIGSASNQSLSAPDGQRPTHFRVFKQCQEIPSDQLPVQRAARGEIVRSEELRVVFEDGTYIDELVSATPIRDGAGTIVGAVGAAVDISERKAAEERVRHTALHDPLTALPNRLLFYDRLGNALARARRTGACITVMLLDLDQFKEVNDSMGHTAGDVLLCEVAARLRGLTRVGDTWARLGGDEFALLQEGIAEADAADQTACRVLAALDSPFLIEEQEIEISASLGVTVFPDHGDTAERLIRNADVALYRAKAAGRSRFERYGYEMDRQLLNVRNLQRGLRRALAEGELELAYQPMFDLPSQRLSKVEALLRWILPDGGQIPPASFIPIAETSGLIHPLGEWVLQVACRQAAAWRDAGRPLKTAVNVSAAQLRRSEFADSVREALDGAGLAASLLEIELTESVFLDPSKEQIHDTLRRLAEQGVTLAIDDFGIGYSSLAYLKHFPFDEVKIDGSFVADIGLAPDGGAIAAAVVGLAHSLGKRVTAEGVETGEQLAFLRDQGCDAAQGFLLGRPGPADGVVQLLAAAA